MSEALLAGWARAEITPPLGSRLRGYFHERLAEGVHDPLLAKAVHFRCGDATFTLVGLDLCTVDRRVTARVREAVAERLDLPGESVVLHATHTHLGPFAHEHVEFLAERVLLAVAQATQTLAPVTVSGGRGFEDRVAFCRRFVMRDGSVRTNPGRRNPEVVAPTSPIDPQLETVILRAPDGRSLVIANYALHLDTVGGNLMGADYPFYMERLIRRVHGPDMDLLFLQGCSGDINHVDVSREDQPKGFAQAEEIGTMLGAELLKVLARPRPLLAAPLSVARQVLAFRCQRPSAEDVAVAERIRSAAVPGLREELVAAARTLALAERDGPWQIEVTVARLGELAIVMVPGELFCEYGRRLKSASPARQTLVAELCHDDVRYIPTPDAARAGGYEAWNSLLPPGAGGKMVDTALQLLSHLRVPEGRGPGQESAPPTG